MLPPPPPPKNNQLNRSGSGHNGQTSPSSLPPSSSPFEITSNEHPSLKSLLALSFDYKADRASTGCSHPIFAVDLQINDGWGINRIDLGEVIDEVLRLTSGLEI